jgi:hypothetical protein
LPVEVSPDLAQGLTMPLHPAPLLPQLDPHIAAACMAIALAIVVVVILFALPCHGRANRRGWWS